MGFPVAAIGFSKIVMYFFLVPIRTGVPLQDVWAGMSIARKIGVCLLMLATYSVLNRVLAASIFAVREFHDGREIGVLRTLGCVHRKHLRLFWLLFLVGLFSAGPQALVGLALAFYFAPAIPISALEDLGVSASLRRSAVLTKGGYGRIALLFVLYLGLVAASMLGFIGLFVSIPQLLAHAWFRIPSLALAFWTFLLIPQWYMIALTLNYFDQRVRKGEWTSVAQSAP